MKLFCDSSHNTSPLKNSIFTFCTLSNIYTYHSSIIPAVSRATDRESQKNMSSPSSSILGTVSHIYTYPLKGAMDKSSLELPLRLLRQYLTTAAWRFCERKRFERTNGWKRNRRKRTQISCCKPVRGKIRNIIRISICFTN